MTYTPNEADKAAAEKYCPKTSENELATTYDVREAFLAGIQHAKASASPAREEWEKLRDELADKYVFELNGHLFSNNNGEAGNAVGAFCAGFDAACTLIAEPLLAELEKARAENAAMKEAIKEYSCPVYDGECAHCGVWERQPSAVPAWPPADPAKHHDGCEWRKLQGAGEKV